MTKQIAIGAILSLLFALPAAAQNGPAAPVIVTPDNVQWTASAMLPAGGKIAVIDGDYTKAGPYTLRISLPDGAAFPPHFHAGAEYVTVLQGTFLVGIGDTADPAKMTALPAGSFAMVPAGVHHFAIAKGATILQLSGMGPMTMTDVKPGMP